jgi:aryl-alcohol dehydrogenase-like predicted oxidoreductase/predicted kinase
VTNWLTPSELRIGLGCMRLEGSAAETIAAAVESGITVFDTARAYEGSEAFLAHALRGVDGARIVTKGGMSRARGAWIPDGRAKAIRADCEASLEALDGLPIDLYLLHAPDRRTPLRTSVRALARLVDDGLVLRVGVCNVNRAQLDEALEWAPIAAVQVAINPFDDRALRGGVVERCAELGVAVIAHSPLGGPKRAPRLARHQGLAQIAANHAASEAEVALAWLVGLGPEVVAIPGARRPETARSAARAASLRLDDDERDRLGPARRQPVRATGGGDVLVVMGVPGAGKSRVAADYAARGYVRLNRDERGGSLTDLADALDEVLASGSREVVLDNTYLKRAARNRIVEAAGRHGIPARCIWVDTPLAQAQVNVVERLLDRFGALPAPEELEQAARSEAGLLSATQQMRAFRELEPPADDEGFAAVEHVQFVRASRTGVAGVFVAAGAVQTLPVQDADPTAPHLVFDWRPGADVAELEAARAAVAAAVSGPVEAAVCPHPGGPPTCWCRPPLPGLVLAFARRHGVDPASSLVVGASPAHRTLANALAARYVQA